MSRRIQIRRVVVRGDRGGGVVVRINCRLRHLPVLIERLRAQHGMLIRRALVDGRRFRRDIRVPGGVLRLTRLRPVFPLERFMQQHFEVCLISEAPTLRENSRARKIARVDPNGNRRRGPCLASPLQNLAEVCCPTLTGTFHPGTRLLPMIKPPLSFFRFGLKLRNLRMFIHNYPSHTNSGRGLSHRMP